MSELNKYSQYFTKEYLMGPNSFRLLEELLRRNPYKTCFDRTLDPGCGHEYGIRDQSFLEKGLARILNFPLVYIHRKRPEY